MKDLVKLLCSIIGCELVGILGTPFTLAAIPTWYTNLNKPFFSPPSWIFGPAWAILYFLMGVAIYLVLKRGWEKRAVKGAVVFFLAQLSLNFIWSPIFFGLKSPLWGLVTIVAMWAFIVITMKKFYPLSKLAFYLLIPYLLWVSFATVLNAAILILN